MGGVGRSRKELEGVERRRKEAEGLGRAWHDSEGIRRNQKESEGVRSQKESAASALVVTHRPDSLAACCTRSSVALSTCEREGGGQGAEL